MHLSYSHLEQLVTIPESVSTAHRALGQDGPDVVVGPHLQPVLHIHGALEADAEATPAGDLFDVTNLEEKSERAESTFPFNKFC